MSACGHKDASRRIERGTRGEHIIDKEYLPTEECLRYRHKGRGHVGPPLGASEPALISCTSVRKRVRLWDAQVARQHRRQSIGVIESAS